MGPSAVSLRTESDQIPSLPGPRPPLCFPLEPQALRRPKRRATRMTAPQAPVLSSWQTGRRLARKLRLGVASSIEPKFRNHLPPPDPSHCTRRGHVTHGCPHVSYSQDRAFHRNKHGRKRGPSWTRRAAEKTGLGGSESRQTHPDSSGELLGEGVVASLGKPWSVQLTRTRRWEVGKQGWEPRLQCRLFYCLVWRTASLQSPRELCSLSDTLKRPSLCVCFN